jgi:hypothetical protein
MKNFINELKTIYLLLFWAITPIVIGMSPIIPYLITNNESWLFLLFLSQPCAVVAALKCWEFPGVEPVTEPVTNEQPKENINRIEL